SPNTPTYRAFRAVPTPLYPHAVKREGYLSHGFDPSFDDAVWSDEWTHQRLLLVPPARHPSGYRIDRELVDVADVFGRTCPLSRPFECRRLAGPGGRVWMSTMPQEVMMMLADARASRGHVLVGGLGLAVYPQLAQQATSFTIVERCGAVRDLVEPTLR